MRIGEWVDEALCAQIGHDPFFPEAGDPGVSGKSICVSCPVQPQCLQYALDADEQYGIWGGFNTKERKKIKRAIHS